MSSKWQLAIGIASIQESVDDHNLKVRIAAVLPCTT